MMTFPSSLNSGWVNALASFTASLIALIPVLMFFRYYGQMDKESSRSVQIQKHQTPKYKHQITSKLTPTGDHANRWKLKVIWSLVVGFWCFSRILKKVSPPPQCPVQSALSVHRAR